MATTPLSKCGAHPSASPPSGFLDPPGKREALAVKAIGENRLTDAAKHIAALPEGPPETRAWRLYLQARLELKSGRWEGAEALFLQSSAIAFVGALNADASEAAIAYRLAAQSLEHAGFVQRHNERGTQAIATHSAAYQLRSVHGTVEEQWQSALSLGSSYSLSRDYQSAVNWLTRSLDFASRASDARGGKLAVVYGQLANTSREMGRLEEAALAARKSLEHWRAHDVSAVMCAEAEYRLGDILVACAEKSEEPDGVTTAELLAKAIECLQAAADSLAAFGGPHARTARVCRDRLDFAERLRASMAPTAD